jgi:hypothetical protein
VVAFRPHEGGTGQDSKTEASTSAWLVANDDVIVEVNARLPTWFAKNVRQV